jgi:tetratricopeptide (TPR) repeat protein
MHLARSTIVPLLLLGLALPLRGEESVAGLEAFRTARRAYSEENMTIAREAIIAKAQDDHQDFSAQFDAAECLRITGSELRTRRQTHSLKGKEAKELKQQQEVWSTQGQAFAERALALADTEERKALVHRVYAELYANSITGMMAGLRNGPKARTHMNEALARTPEDPECQRAIAIMYLNNPPFNGGDVGRAITTFDSCHQRVPDNDIYAVLLTMAYQKNKNWTKAMESAETALQINPANPNAAALKKAIASKLEAAE